MCETDLEDEDGRGFTPSRGQSQFFIKSVMLETLHPSPALNPDPRTIQTCRSRHCSSRGHVGDFNPSSEPFDMNSHPKGQPFPLRSGDSERSNLAGPWFAFPKKQDEFILDR